LVATPQILPPPRRVRTADASSFMEKPFVEVDSVGARDDRVVENLTVSIGRAR
jgi:hypothetical protein